MLTYIAHTHRICLTVSYCVAEQLLLRGSGSPEAVSEGVVPRHAVFLVMTSMHAWHPPPSRGIYCTIDIEGEAVCCRVRKEQ